MLNPKYTLIVKNKLLIIILLVFSPICQLAQAQDIIELMRQDKVKVNKLERKGDRYFKNRDKGKGSGYKLYMRNLYWAKRNADANGRVISDSQVLNESQGFRRSWNKNAGKMSRSIQRSSTWQELGPFSWTRTRSWSPGLGRIVSIAVEPTQQEIIYAGSPGGGIWKSVDAGRSWRPLGDNMINMFIWSIAIDPNNSNIIFLGNSAGQVMKSIDGGNSWVEIYQVNGTPRRILIHPNSSIMYIGTTRALYRSQNGGASFSRVLNAKAEDVEFKPGNTNVVYACGDNFYRSTNGGTSFSRITSGITRSERMKMAVTPADPNVVYLVQKRGSGFGRLYRSLDGGASFSIRADYNSVSTRDVYFTQASRDMAITVSDTNANEVHLGGMNYSRSLDGGVNFTTLAAWNQPNDPSYVHADIEVLQYINGVIYIGTDGGIFRSTNRGNSCTDLTQGGLAVRQYYRIGGAATDANMIVGGAQDNGTNIMNGSNRQFKEWLGADGMECFIDHKNKFVVYGTTQFGSLYKSTDGGNSIGSISKPVNYRGEWVTPFSMDPIDNNTIYAGYNNLYRSRNGGRSGSWRNITETISTGGNLDEMAVAPSDNNYIYIANGSRLWRTKNGQSTNPSWTEVSNFRGTVNYITVDPTNPERVAIATSGSRVYTSTNAGTTWANVRGNLPSISAQCLVFDDTGVNGLYVGMQSGVYYTNDDLDEWIPFSTNLPGVLTTDLEIHYPTRKIRVATYGRGIWESDLYDAAGNEVSAPSNLTAGVNGRNILLTWQDNADNENGFSLERSNGGAYQVIANLAANTQTYLDEDLAGGTYTYRVRAWDETNYSDYSNTAQAIIDDGGTPPGVIEDCNGCVVYNANSEETVRADQGKEKAADGDPNTYWHTNWYDDNSSHPHYIAIDLGQQRDLVGFSYLGRQTGTTGMVKDYQFFGWDGNSWQQLATGSFQKTTLKQTVEFEKFRCRYVYLRALSEVDGKRWASIAEFKAQYVVDQNTRPGNMTNRVSSAAPTVDLNDFEGLQVFPVPFSDELNVKGIGSKKVIRSMKLISTGGAVNKPKLKVSDDVITIDTRDLSSGLYILYFEENGTAKRIKVVKK